MGTLIVGAGNTLLSDEGWGVHVVRHLEAHYVFPAGVELLDAGTLGLMIAHRLEDAERVYLLDVILAEGPPGEVRRYGKQDIMLKRIPARLSPHQIGLQEMLLMMELRGRCPADVTLIGVIPATLEPGNALSPALQQTVEPVSRLLAGETGGKSCFFASALA